jgi:hypothetical protein
LYFFSHKLESANYDLLIQASQQGEKKDQRGFLADVNRKQFKTPSKQIMVRGRQKLSYFFPADVRSKEKKKDQQRQGLAQS